MTNKLSLVFLILLFSFFGYSNFKSVNVNYSTTNDVIAIEQKNIKKVDVDLKRVNDKKEFLRKWFLKNRLKIKQEVSISEIKFSKYSCVIFKVSLTNEAPTSLNKKYFFIYFNKMNTCFLVPVEFDKIFINDNDFLISGYKEYREYDFYHMYKLNGNVLDLVLDTSSDCDSGIKVGYYRNDECFEYLPNRFGSKLIRTDKIIFTGKINEYCKEGVDRMEQDVKPIKVQNCSIIYRYSKSKKRWMLQKESVYKCW